MLPEPELMPCARDGAPSREAPGDRRRVLVASDDRILTERLGHVVRQAGGLVVGACAHDPEEAAAYACDQRPDAVVVGFPAESAFRYLRAVPRDAARRTRALVLYKSGDRTAAFRAMRLQACGVVAAGDEPGLASSVRAVAAGGYAVDGREFRDYASALRCFAELREFKVALHGLTPRELEIMHGVSRGAANKEIASACGISPDTVKHHLSRIFEKVGVTSRLELALFAVRNRLVDE